VRLAMPHEVKNVRSTAAPTHARKV
jgi:hypothetical protein